jgi:hypothetical protein
VGDGKGLNEKIAYLKDLIWRKRQELLTAGKLGLKQGRGALARVDGALESSCDLPQPTDVIRMLMGDQDPINAWPRPQELLQSLQDLSLGEAHVNEQPSILGDYQRTVATAAAG